MKNTIFFATAAMILFAASCGQKQPQSGDKIDILAWAQMPVDKFGCMMEKTFGYRHERFNCSLKDYVNNGDPSKNTEEYYEGPGFPENLAKKVHPWIREINLNWEGGSLQLVTFLFDRELNLTEEQILTEFGIDPDNLPENIHSIDASFGSLSIEGFIHTGAGDFDYESNPAPPPPGIIVGKWVAPVKRGHVAYLEIFEDGMAGLYLGSDDDDQLYEIYRGVVCPADDVDIDGDGVDYLIEMNFDLEWYIYESDGAPIDVPGSYKGTYVLRHEQENGKRVLYVKTVEDTSDNLFGKKELKMIRVN